MAYLQLLIMLLLVLAPVLLPATITGFHIVADVLRNRRALSHAS